MNISWGNSVGLFQRSLNTLSKDVEKDMEKIVDEVASRVISDARRATPVETGKLRKAWKHRRSGKGAKRRVTISNRKDYALDVEFGTSKMAPRRMLTKAVIRGRKNMENRLKYLKRKLGN